jgi:hypothetical protein
MERPRLPQRGLSPSQRRKNMDKFGSYFAFTVSAVGLAVLGLATAGLSFAGETAAPPSHQVTICHATRSATNPYVTITVDVSSAGEAQSLRGHREHSDDVIPTFVYDGVTYPGQGDQSILADGCNVSQATSTQITTTETTTGPAAARPAEPDAPRSQAGPQRPHRRRQRRSLSSSTRTFAPAPPSSKLCEATARL